MYVIQHGASESLGPCVRSVEEENRRVAYLRKMSSVRGPDGISLDSSPREFHEPFPNYLATRGFRLVICGASGEQKRGNEEKKNAGKEIFRDIF